MVDDVPNSLYTVAGPLGDAGPQMLTAMCGEDTLTMRLQRLSCEPARPSTASGPLS